MPGRLTLKTVNNELARLGHRVVLEKGSGYFYFRTGEAADWLDRTVPVAKISDLTLKERVQQFKRLKALNEQIMGTPRTQPPGSRQSADLPGAEPRPTGQESETA